MEEKAAPSLRAERSTSDAPASGGGTVEPADRAKVAIRTFQIPDPEPGERYELRDPFADLTYRSDRYQDITTKADQLGANRFVVLDARGQKSFVHKVDGQWQRGEPPEPQRPSPAAPSERTAPETAPSQASARLDAQAEREALVARLETALTDRYIIKRAPVTVGDLSIGLTEYRFRGDSSRVAFTESTFRLATDTNSPSVARSMVDVAEARNWQSLRVTGNEEFRRMVWLEAVARGVKTLGYEPNLSDQERLKVERELRQTNRIEPARDAGAAHGNGVADKPAGRGSGGRKTVLAAIEAILVANRVPEKRREAILAAAEQKLAQRIREGQIPKVKLYDKNAPSQRPVVTPTQVQQRTRERAAPVR